MKETEAPEHDSQAVVDILVEQLRAEALDAGRGYARTSVAIQGARLAAERSAAEETGRSKAMTRRAEKLSEGWGESYTGYEKALKRLQAADVGASTEVRAEIAALFGPGAVEAASREAEAQGEFF